MKVCVIGDIHGTTKFLDCYNEILSKDNDCEKIIVCGDHFDPYENIPFDECVEKYNEFIDACKNDSRIVSLLGNHDLATYVLGNDSTNRTYRTRNMVSTLSDIITKNLPDSYLCYKIDNYLFSHAGVSQVWLDNIAKYNAGYETKIMENHKGWTVDELTDLVSFRYDDWSGYGNATNQGCTWIRPQALNKSAVEGYNQVVGHTQVENISKVKMNNGMYLWLVDDMRKSNYLVIDTKESE